MELNLPTIVIGLILAGLFALAIRQLVRKGTCAGCDQCAQHSDSSDCCGHCSAVNFDQNANKRQSVEPPKL
jgi:hypothetical protein